MFGLLLNVTSTSSLMPHRHLRWGTAHNDDPHSLPPTSCLADLPFQWTTVPDPASTDFPNPQVLHGRQVWSPPLTVSPPPVSQIPALSGLQTALEGTRLDGDPTPPSGLDPVWGAGEARHGAPRPLSPPHRLEHTAGFPSPSLHPQLPELWAARRTLTAGPRAQARAPTSTQSQRAGGGLGGRMVRPGSAAGGPAPVKGGRMGGVPRSARWGD